MRILMTSYEFPPIGGGGAAVVAGLSRELVAKGHDVDLVTMRFKGNPLHEDVDGVQVHRVPCLRRVKHVCTAPEAFSYVAAAFPVIRELLSRNRYDITHAHFILPDGLLAWRVRQVSGLPYVITAHGTDVPGFNPHRMKLAHRILRPLWRKVVGGANRIVSPSGVLEQLVLAQRPAPGKTLVIPNGLEVGAYTPYGTEPKVLVVTRMLERKGVQFLLESLAQSPIDREVNIVGEGPHLPELRRQADETGVAVKFWGWLDNHSPKLRELYESSTIFVFPSEAENFPIVLLEAMAAGLAIITTEGTGCAEVVGGAGMLIPPKDPQAITRALRRLIDEPELRRSLGAAARRRIEENFTWSAVAGRYLEEYARHAARPGDWAMYVRANGAAPRSHDSVLSD
ncbi:MAG: glycosyltransferase family 4 protein [Gemmatimonadales bacterium]